MYMTVVALLSPNVPRHPLATVTAWWFVCPCAMDTPAHRRYRYPLRQNYTQTFRLGPRTGRPPPHHTLNTRSQVTAGNRYAARYIHFLAKGRNTECSITRDSMTGRSAPTVPAPQDKSLVRNYIASIVPQPSSFPAQALIQSLPRAIAHMPIPPTARRLMMSHWDRPPPPPPPPPPQAPMPPARHAGLAALQLQHLIPSPILLWRPRVEMHSHSVALLVRVLAAVVDWQPSH